MPDHPTDTRAQAAAEARARLIPRRACSCVDACVGGDTTEYCRGLPAPERATDTRAAETPVKIKVSQNTFWWLVDRSRERFGGDLDATILDLLQRVEGGRRDA